MIYNKNDIEINEETLVTVLQQAINAVKTDEDPEQISKLRKIFKQTVPFTLRSYVAAYLAKQLSNRAINRREFSGHHCQRLKGDFPKTSAQPEAPHSSRRVTIEEGDGATIFISVGRNRHVFVKELVGLLVQVAGLERERIGIIKVLDNYSFIQLFADDAKIAIEKLNGYEYRGRKLMVSYSRKKEVIEANAESGITGEYEKNSAEAGDIGDVQSGAASVSVNENKDFLI